MRYQIISLCLIIILILFIITPIHFVKNSPSFSILNNIVANLCKKLHTTSIVKLNKEVCYENLHIINKIFKKHNIFFWLSEGTALGFIRSNDIIDHDDDVDIGIWNQDRQKLIDSLYDLNRYGFKVFNVALSGSLIALVRKFERVDIDITGYSLDCAAHYDKCDTLIPFLQKFNKIKINNLIYNIPTIQYIERLYGKNWRIPIKNYKPIKK